jgi:hypothetical protein
MEAILLGPRHSRNRGNLPGLDTEQLVRREECHLCDQLFLGPVKTVLELLGMPDKHGHIQARGRLRLKADHFVQEEKAVSLSVL